MGEQFPVGGRGGTSANTDESPHNEADGSDETGASRDRFDDAGDRTDRASASESDSLSVLHLTTSPEAAFYRTQIESLAARGIDCETLAVPGMSDGSADDVNRSPLDYVRFFPQVRRAVVRGDYDIVQANYGLTAPHALLASDVPVVLSLWGSDVFGSMGWMSKLVAPRCDAVVTMSDRLGRAVGCDYTVIPHGIDFEQFRPQPRAAAREELGWDPDAYHVLFPAPVAREEKNFPRAKRVVRAVEPAVSKPVVLQTPDGRVPYELMPTLMNASDALLLTSRHEGFPNAVKEALACNVPVVSTDVGDVAQRLASVTPSVVASSDDELADGLTEVLQADARSNGRDVIGDMRIERVAARLESVYHRVIE